MPHEDNTHRPSPAQLLISDRKRMSLLGQVL
jgi:hypothetical protein